MNAHLIRRVFLKNTLQNDVQKLFKQGKSMFKTISKVVLFNILFDIIVAFILDLCYNIHA